MQKIYKDYLTIPAGLSGTAYQAKLTLSLAEQISLQTAGALVPTIS